MRAGHAWLVGAAFGIAALVGWAQSAAGAWGGGGVTGGSLSPISYAVVMTSDESGAVQFKAIGSCDVKTQQKSLIAQYTEACKAYMAARKDNPSEPRPKKPAFRVVQDRISGQGAKERAESLAAKCQERYDKLHSKKDETSASN